MLSPSSNTARRNLHEAIVGIGIEHPRWVTGTLVAVALALAVAAALPTIWPQSFPFLEAVRVDTDPENMLRDDESVRMFHNQMKRELNLHDMVVVGVVNDEHEDGVFNPESLRQVHELTEFAKGLRWPSAEDPEISEGVVAIDIIAPSVVENIEQAGVGSVSFDWLMPEPPQTREEALSIRDRAQRIPLFDGTMVASNGRALALYLPLTSKDASYEVYRRLQEKIETFDGHEQYFITGLPVAEDTFGVEMFIQMAVSAPLAMLVIFALLFYFFRNLRLIAAPMIIALGAVILTMGLLVVTGNTIHIMSSMIPIFIMPIAVLDSVHVLSEFFDRYPETRDRRATIVEIMKTLASPMLYTTITSCAGFASLVLTPIPPVQVFGLFVAFGIAMAWLLTVVFVPAYIMMMPESSLEAFGASESEQEHTSPLARALLRFGPAAARHARPILVVAILACVVAGWGISLIEINDNPIRWFNSQHPIRVADRVLNEHFGGTYMAYLALPVVDEDIALPDFAESLAERALTRGDELKSELPKAAGVFELLAAEARRAAVQADGIDALLGDLETHSASALESAQGWDEADAWDAADLFVSRERLRRETFKRPDVLRYVEELSRHLSAQAVVGKTSGLPEIVKTVHRELLPEGERGFRIPATAEATAQTLVTYQSSHRPQDLWHFVRPDYRLASLWVQLKSGDNRDMMRVVETTERFFEQNPPPVAMDPQWFGLTYINVVWQKKMVEGMRNAFLGSFVVVLVIMSLLFRSALWGLLSMIPLALTIALIYGVVGIVGKDYDMPVAVLSSLALGLAVDFAIHFLVRTRSLYRSARNWEECVDRVFGEPARAIARNVIVIAIGFSPLLIAPLIPYRTVGVLMASILVISGLATLVILPALVRVGERWLFRDLASEVE
ncbi:MAG: MMPL family transporter [bacterium]|nr:MMPL family transporter [bacterium]